MNIRRILPSIALVVGAVVFSIGIQAFAFTQPTATPPGNDAYAPLHTGPIWQAKDGGFGVRTPGGYSNNTLGLNARDIGSSGSETLYINWGDDSGDVQIGGQGEAKTFGIAGVVSANGTGNNYFAGNVGVGVASTSQKLDVNGYVKGTGFCIGANCITSWPVGGTGGGTVGDNLGNHTATQDLNMNGKSIIGGDGTYTPGMAAGSNKISFRWDGANVTSRVDIIVMPLQRRVSSNCSAGSSIRQINYDGTVACETDDVGTTGTTPTNPWTEADGNVYRSSGNVGVGTTNPNFAKLSIEGEAGIKSAYYTANTLLIKARDISSVGTESLYINWGNDSGDVQIGGEGEWKTLLVTGSGYFTGNVAAISVAAAGEVRAVGNVIAGGDVKGSTVTGGSGSFTGNVVAGGDVKGSTFTVGNVTRSTWPIPILETEIVTGGPSNPVILNCQPGWLVTGGGGANVNRSDYLTSVPTSKTQWTVSWEGGVKGYGSAVCMRIN